MPTAKREIYDDAIYHIIQRGNNRQVILKDERDFKKFLSIARGYKLVYPFEVYNYCLMQNHVHLLIRVPNAKDLPKLMQGLFQSFRFYFRKMYNYTGYLYQGRYKSKLINKDEYLLECARYIERNPLRAGIITDLKDYRWSSYCFYAYGHKDKLITYNPLYLTLTDDNKRRRKLYKEYVLESRIYEEMLDKGFKIR